MRSGAASPLCPSGHASLSPFEVALAGPRLYPFSPGHLDSPGQEIGVSDEVAAGEADANAFEAGCAVSESDACTTPLLSPLEGSPGHKSLELGTLFLLAPPVLLPLLLLLLLLVAALLAVGDVLAACTR